MQIVYAIKKYDNNRIPDKKIKELCLTPTSANAKYSTAKRIAKTRESTRMLTVCLVFSNEMPISPNNVVTKLMKEKQSRGIRRDSFSPAMVYKA